MPATAPLYDASALRALERNARAASRGDEFEWMRRAGQAAWRSVLEHWPQAVRIVVACGPGNNGGDGYVLARHALESGRDATVVRLAAHAPRSELARRACDDYLAARGRVATFDGTLPVADLVVDAVFGIGLSRAPDAEASALFDAIDASGVPVLALDVPSGVDADSGDVPGRAVRATRTLQFMAAHAGLHTGAALDHVGARSLDALDLPDAAWTGIEPVARLLGADALHGVMPPRRRDTHKGAHGHVLCIGGDAGMGGAIVLSAESALRCGAGLVTVATHAVHMAPLLSRRPECMVVAAGSAASIEDALRRASVLAVGPGLGRGPWGRGLFEAAAHSGKPCVFDADALFHLAAAPCALGDAVLTPHPGEAARLLRDSGIASADRFAVARALVERHGCVVVLKGAGTIVAAPGRTPRVIDAGNPGMATGGMGDVLTGVVAALRAQGLDAFDAACHGALLHARAGDMAARDGERGLLPSDLFAPLRMLANIHTAHVS